MNTIGKIIFGNPLFKNRPEAKSWLAENSHNQAKMLKLEWAFIYNTLIECRAKVERAYGRSTWIDPAIDIAKERMKGE